MENCPDLEKILAPIDLATFNASYFEKRPLLISRDCSSHYAQLLSLESISTYLDRRDIRYPSVRLVKDGLELPQTDYIFNLPFGNQSFEGLINNDRLFSLFGDGATIVFQALHRSLSPLSMFCQHIEKYFKFPLQTNVYLTPASSQGFASHFDNHDVFILQAHGSKIWRVYDSPVSLPTKPFDKNKWQSTKPQIEVELKAGDTLYIPRGFVHEALTTKDISLHITLGLLTYTWIDVLRLLLEDAHSINGFRESFNWNNSTEEEIKSNITKLSRQLIDNTSFINLKNEFHGRFSKKSLTSDHQRLNDMIEFQTIGFDSVLVVREEINYKLETFEEKVILKFYHKSIRLPYYVANTLGEILSGSRFKIADLKGDLDEDEKLVLCKRLVKEGFLSIFRNAV